MLLSLDTALLALSYIFTPEAVPPVEPAVPPLVGRSGRLMEEPFLLKPEREEAATQPVTLPTVTFT